MMSLTGKTHKKIFFLICKKILIRLEILNWLKIRNVLQKKFKKKWLEFKNWKKIFKKI